MTQINYAYSIKNSDQKSNESEIYRNPISDDINRNEGQNATLYNVYKKLAQRSGKNLIGVRRITPYKNLENQYYFYSVQTILKKAERIGSALKSMNLSVQDDFEDYKIQTVGFYSQNNINYFIADIACGMYNFTAVPIYDSHGETGTKYIFEQTKLELCFAETRLLQQLLKYREDNQEYHKLKTIVILDEENFNQQLKSISDDISILSFSEFEKQGLEKYVPWKDINPESIYCISYTSGSTGTPKGAMLSHKNILNVVMAVSHHFHINENDIYYSYLPMAHTLERVVFNTLLFKQASIGLHSKGIRNMREDLQILKPTIFVSVPRVLTRIHQEINKKIRNQYFPIKFILQNAIKSKKIWSQITGSFSNTLIDQTIFKPIRNLLGGNIRLMLTGSAPIDGQVLNDLKLFFGCQILEGYGQTETAGFAFVTHEKDLESGHLGGINCFNEFKLVDVEDLNYRHTDKDETGQQTPRGELWLRGPIIIPGYYKLQDQNTESFTKDGWLKTGDIGMLAQPGNRFKLIDRKKNIFKLSQGEYIVPDKLENIYQKCNHNFEDVFVYGDSKKSCIIGIVNIKKENIKKIQEELGAPNEKDLKQKILQLFQVERIKHKLNGLEVIRDIFIENQDWQEMGLITNTMKKKRNEIEKYYQKEFQKMYEKMNEQ